jgi:hypothetical protein
MKIVIITGSNRRNSASTRMARFVGERLKTGGHSVDLWDLYTKPLPFYDPDEEIEPESVVQLARAVTEADAVVLATPEYHGSLSGVLKMLWIIWERTSSRVKWCSVLAQQEVQSVSAHFSTCRLSFATCTESTAQNGFLSGASNGVSTIRENLYILPYALV